MLAADVGAHALHFVPFAVTNTGNNSVTLYKPGSSSVAATVSKGVNAPKTAAFDQKGNLYVANATSVTVYAAGSTHVLRTIAQNIAVPAALAFDPSDNLYVANQANNSITVYGPTGTPYLRTVTTGIKFPDSVAFDRSGSLYVSNRGDFSGKTSSVTVYAPGKTTPAYTIKHDVKLPLAVTVDRHGNVYVANVGSNSVTVYAPHRTSPKLRIHDGVVVPSALALDKNDDLYVASLVLNRITIYAPGSTRLRGQIRKGLNYPTGMAFDGTGTLYVSNLRGNAITAYAPKTHKLLGGISSGISHPSAVAFSPSDVTLSAPEPTPQPSLLPQSLFVLSSGGNEIDGFTLPLGQLPPTAVRVTNSLNEPQDVFFDSQGDLFTSNANPYPGEFLEFTAPYTNAPTIVPGVGFGSATVTAFDANNDLFFPTCGQEPTLVELPPPYTTAAVTFDGSNKLVNACSGLALDGQGDLFVNDFNGFGSGNVYEYQQPISSSSLPVLAIPPVGGTPDAELLDIDPNGNLFIADKLDVFSPNTSFPYTIAVYAPPYTGSPTATITIDGGVNCAGNGIRAMAVDASSDLFVGISGCILEFAPPYTGGPVADFDQTENPSSMVTDPSGNLYVLNGNSGSNLALEYSPPFSNSSQPVGWAGPINITGDNKYALALSPPTPSPAP